MSSRIYSSPLSIRSTVCVISDCSPSHNLINSNDLVFKELVDIETRCRHLTHTVSRAARARSPEMVVDDASALAAHL